MQTTEQKNLNVRVNLKGKNAKNYKRLQTKWGFTVTNQVLYHLLAEAYRQELGEA
jgi:hypothetical protein